MAQRGKGKMLIIADTPLHAKAMAHRHSEATIVLARPEEYLKLQFYLNAQGIKPAKVCVLSEALDRDKQSLIAVNCRQFYTEGADIFLMKFKDGSIMKVDPVALEKARLKMSFEKLLSQKPAKIEPTGQPTAQERFDVLKKEFPLLEQYERNSKDRKQVQGYAREQIDKKLQSLAKEIVQDKKLMSILQRDLPNVTIAIKKQIQQSLDRGIHR